MGSFDRSKNFHVSEAFSVKVQFARRPGVTNPNMLTHLTFNSPPIALPYDSDLR